MVIRQGTTGMIAAHIHQVQTNLVHGGRSNCRRDTTSLLCGLKTEMTAVVSSVTKVYIHNKYRQIGR